MDPWQQAQEHKRQVTIRTHQKAKQLLNKQELTADEQTWLFDWTWKNIYQTSPEIQETRKQAAKRLEQEAKQA